MLASPYFVSRANSRSVSHVPRSAAESITSQMTSRCVLPPGLLRVLLLARAIIRFGMCTSAVACFAKFPSPARPLAGGRNPSSPRGFRLSPFAGAGLAGLAGPLTLAGRGRAVGILVVAGAGAAGPSRRARCYLASKQRAGFSTHFHSLYSTSTVDFYY